MGVPGTAAQQASATAVVVSSLQLPALDSNASARELAFRRLLYSAEQQLAACLHEQASEREGASLSAASKLKHCLLTLEDQLGDLERMQASLRVGGEKLAQYKQHVKHLASQAPEPRLPRFCQRPAPSKLAAGGVPVGSLSMTNLTAAANALAAAANAANAANAAASTASGPPGSSSIQGKGALPLSAAGREVLDQQQGLQEDLEEELVAMAANLKASMLSTQRAVHQRGKLVDATESAMDDNVAVARKVAARSKEQYKRSSGTFCLTCMVLLVVGMVFTAMAVYIKMTYFIGFRASSSSSSSSSPSWAGGAGQDGGNQGGRSGGVWGAAVFAAEAVASLVRLIATRVGALMGGSAVDANSAAEL